MTGPVLTGLIAAQLAAQSLLLQQEEDHSRHLQDALNQTQIENCSRNTLGEHDFNGQLGNRYLSRPKIQPNKFHNEACNQ